MGVADCRHAGGRAAGARRAESSLSQDACIEDDLLDSPASRCVLLRRETGADIVSGLMTAAARVLPRACRGGADDRFIVHALDGEGALTPVEGGHGAAARQLDLMV